MDLPPINIFCIRELSDDTPGRLVSGASGILLYGPGFRLSALLVSPHIFPTSHQNLKVDSGRLRA